MKNNANKKILTLYVIFIILLLLLIYKSGSQFILGWKMGSQMPAEELEKLNIGMLVLRFALSISMIICYVVMFVYIFLMLSALRKNIMKGSVFDRKITKYTRIIGVLSIIIPFLVSIMMATSQYMQMKIVAGSASISLNFMDIFDLEKVIFGVVILCFAEVFSIGYNLQEEQNLTI